MKNAVLILLLALVGISVGSPSDSHTVVHHRQRRDLHVIDNAVKVIEETVKKLLQLGQQAVDAVDKFAAQVEEYRKQFQAKLVENLNELKERVSKAIQSVADSGVEINDTVKECIDSNRIEAADLFNTTAIKIMECADKRFEEVYNLITELTTVANNALKFGNDQLEEMKKCTANPSESAANTGKCLAAVAVHTQTQGAVFVAQIGKLMTQITVAIATLPVSLQLCTGAHLAGAAVETGKIVLEIGKCVSES